MTTTADQVKALIRSHADGHDNRFFAIAKEIAAEAARSGDGRFAAELHELLAEVARERRHREHRQLLAERKEVLGFIADTSEEDVLDRMSWVNRLSFLDAAIAAAKPDDEMPKSDTESAPE